MLKHFDLYYSVYLGPSETVRGSNFFFIFYFILFIYFLFLLLDFYYSVLPFVLFVTKRESNFYFGPGMYFQTGQVIFVPE
jgi:hypothetical protein